MQEWKKKVFRKILVIAILALALLCFVPSRVHAELTDEQKGEVATFAKSFVNEGNSKRILRYSQSNRTVGFNNSKKDGVMYFDCSSFVCFVFNKTCNAQLGCLTTGGLYDSDQFEKVGKYPDVQPRPGELLCRPNTIYPNNRSCSYLYR